jgi:hypothetical protein
LLKSYSEFDSDEITAKTLCFKRMLCVSEGLVIVCVLMFCGAKNGILENMIILESLYF